MHRYLLTKPHKGELVYLCGPLIAHPLFSQLFQVLHKVKQPFIWKCWIIDDVWRFSVIQGILDLNPLLIYFPHLAFLSQGHKICGVFWKMSIKLLLLHILHGWTLWQKITSQDMRRHLQKSRYAPGFCFTGVCNSVLRVSILFWPSTVLVVRTL